MPRRPIVKPRKRCPRCGRVVSQRYTGELQQHVCPHAEPCHPQPHAEGECRDCVAERAAKAVTP